MTNSPPIDEDKRRIAVALKHTMATPDAPTVVASGKGKLAEQILAIAFENGVKVREDADLAQILSVVEVDCQIPIEAFTAVAEILAYVYAANRKMMGIMTDLSDIKKRIETVFDRVRTAGVMLSKDQPVDMTGLDKLVEGICRDVTSLKQAEREQFKDDMINLTDEVTHLTNALIAHQEEIRKALDDVKSHSKAAKAYGAKKPGS